MFRVCFRAADSPVRCAPGEGNRVEPVFFFPRAGGRVPAGTRKSRPPRGARRGTGGCHRVLQNHCTTHVMSLLAALTSAVLLLAGTCVQLCKAGGVEEDTLMQQMLAGLKQQVRTRQERLPLPPLDAADDAEPHDPRVRDQTAALSRALATLLGDAAEAHHLSPEGSWRIACALVADLLCLWLPPGDPPGVAVDAVMDQLGRAVAAQIARARGETAPAPHGRSSAGVREA
jgi:hypothetical protein